MWAAVSSTYQCFCVALRKVLSSLTCFILTLFLMTWSWSHTEAGTVPPLGPSFHLTAPFALGSNTGWEPLEWPLEKIQGKILSNVSLSLQNVRVSAIPSFFCLAQHGIFPYFSLGIYSWDFPALLFPLPGVPDSSSNYVFSIPPFHGFFHECWKLWVSRSLPGRRGS